jgi:hypothetical protein
MKLVVEIPDTVVATLPSENGDLARGLLKSYALEDYKSGKLTACQAQALLDLETRMEVDAFLKAHGAPLEITLQGLEEGRKSLDALLGKLSSICHRDW